LTEFTPNVFPLTFSIYIFFQTVPPRYAYPPSPLVIISPFLDGPCQARNIFPLDRPLVFSLECWLPSSSISAYGPSYFPPSFFLLFFLRLTFSLWFNPPQRPLPPKLPSPNRAFVLVPQLLFSSGFAAVKLPPPIPLYLVFLRRFCPLTCNSAPSFLW